MPKIYGNYRSVHRRFKKWCEKGILEKLLKYVQKDPDLEVSIIDETTLQAHACAVGYTKILEINKHWNVVKVALQQRFVHHVEIYLGKGIQLKHLQRT